MTKHKVFKVWIWILVFAAAFITNIRIRQIDPPKTQEQKDAEIMETVCPDMLKRRPGPDQDPFRIYEDCLEWQKK